jgi:hypothetical protein
MDMKKTHALLLTTALPLIAVVTLFTALLPSRAEETVTVGNQAPAFLTPPVRTEHPTDSDYTQGYTYEAYAYDTGGEDYYLLVCGTSSISSSMYPASCTDTLLCKSDITSSDTTATCVSSIPPEEQADWYVTVCDTNESSQACSEAWNGALPAEEQKVPIAFPSTAAITESTSVPAGPASIEEITYSLLLLFLLCSAVLAVPLLILSVKDERTHERVTVATSLFVIVFTAFLGLVSTWPEEPGVQPQPEQIVLGENTGDNRPDVRNPYSLSGTEGFYPVFSEPTVNALVLYRATEDEVLHVIEHQEYWVRVYLPIGGYGWIPLTSLK